jgi:Domain of unknown function (DUF6438)
MYRIILPTALFLILCSSVFQEQVNEQPVITLEHCGYYRLSLFADGTVIYIGMANVLFVNDTEKTHIPIDTINALLDEAKRIGFERLKDVYNNDTTIGDKTYITDYYPSNATRTTVVLEGNKKEVLEEGKPPKTLIEFENHIDRATHSSRWVGFWPDRFIFVSWKRITYLPVYDTLLLLKQQFENTYYVNGYYRPATTEDKRTGDSTYKAWLHACNVATTPVRDSIIRVRKEVYRSFTDQEIDSIWWARYGP